MNVEEIKDSLRTATLTGWDPEKSDYIEGVTYLLSIIENLEQDLSIIANSENVSAMNSIAEDALKAIRGN